MKNLNGNKKLSEKLLAAGLTHLAKEADQLERDLDATVMENIKSKNIIKAAVEYVQAVDAEDSYSVEEVMVLIDAVEEYQNDK